MCIKTRCSPFVWLLLAGAAAPEVAADPPEKPVSSHIAQTQLTLRLDPLQGRATVVAIAEQTLTIMTAAHFLSPEDVGRTIQIRGRAPSVDGSWPSREIPASGPSGPGLTMRTTSFGTVGVDTAVARIKVDLHRENERRAFAKIRSAEWTREPVLRNSGQFLSVHIVDQHGQEHAVRASNHQNPKWLAWGRQNYDTQPGDSGSGVFLMRTTPEGQPVPILIGNVAQTDERGGLASLAYRNEYWIVRAMAGLPAEPK